MASVKLPLNPLRPRVAEFPRYPPICFVWLLSASTGRLNRFYGGLQAKSIASIPVQMSHITIIITLQGFFGRSRYYDHIWRTCMHFYFAGSAGWLNYKRIYKGKLGLQTNKLVLSEWFGSNVLKSAGSKCHRSFRDVPDSWPILIVAMQTAEAW